MRATGLRLLASLFALSWLVLPGFGLIDLAVTWSSEWPQVLEAGWGLYFTFFVGLAFGFVALRPRDSTPALAQLFVAAAVLAVSSAAAREPGLIWVAVGIGLQAAIVMWVPQREPLARGVHPSSVSRPLLLLAAAGAVPWIVYALRMYELNREGGFSSDITIGIDHYSVQGAVGVALVTLTSLAAVWPQGRRFIGVCAGIVAFYLGLVSLAWPDAAGGIDRLWSAAAMVWGIAFAALAITRAARVLLPRSS